MLPNLANHSVKGFEGGQKAGPRLAALFVAETKKFGRSAYFSLRAEPWVGRVTVQDTPISDA
jgi:hypothetical protein